MKNYSKMFWVLILFIGTGAQGQRPADCPHRGEFPDCRKDRAAMTRQRMEKREPGAMREYVMERRREFDKVLSEEERGLIRALRDDLQEQRTGMRNEMGEGLRRHRGDFAGHREWVHRQLGALDPVIGNHREDLEAVQQEIEAFRRHLREDMQPVRARPGRDSLRRDGDMRVRQFLLIDPDRSLNDQGRVSPSPEAMLLFPNPANDEVTVQFELTTAGRVRLELLDKSGTVVRVLEEADYDAGWHQFATGIADLKAGEMYYVRYSFQGKTLVRKFIRI